jgi:hypothetical protein
METARRKKERVIPVEEIRIKTMEWLESLEAIKGQAENKAGNVISAEKYFNKARGYRKSRGAKRN